MASNSDLHHSAITPHLKDLTENCDSKDNKVIPRRWFASTFVTDITSSLLQISWHHFTTPKGCTLHDGFTKEDFPNIKDTKVMTCLLLWSSFDSLKNSQGSTFAHVSEWYTPSQFLHFAESNISAVY